MNKIHRLIRFIAFVIVGILVILFNYHVETYINYYVGSVMILYGLDILIEDIVHHNFSIRTTKFSEYIILFILGLVTIFIGKDNFYLTCIIWAIWSIDRETMEISHKVLHNYKNRISTIINGIESLVVIVLSILLITDPIEHAHLHVILLGIELILEVSWTEINELEDKIKERKSANK